MRLILTSTLGGHRLAEDRWLPCAIEEQWGLAGLLRQAAGPEISALIIVSDPADHEMNDLMLHDRSASFRQSGIALAGLFLLDDRNRQELPELLARCQLVFLSGGHVPTQNRFFHAIGLREALQGYQGVVVGSSAGSMNCADTVYAQPELAGEAIDPSYQRYLPGLGLTRLSLLPHFRPESREVLDGLELLRDISLPDSFRRSFLCLADGAYLVQQGPVGSVEAETVLLSGAAWLCREGELLPLCGAGEQKVFALAQLL